MKIKEDNAKETFVELYIEIQDGLDWHGAKIQLPILLYCTFLDSSLVLFV